MCFSKLYNFFTPSLNTHTTIRMSTFDLSEHIEFIAAEHALHFTVVNLSLSLSLSLSVILRVYNRICTHTHKNRNPRFYSFIFFFAVPRQAKYCRCALDRLFRMRARAGTEFGFAGWRFEKCQRCIHRMHLKAESVGRSVGLFWWQKENDLTENRK